MEVRGHRGHQACAHHTPTSAAHRSVSWRYTHVTENVTALTEVTKLDVRLSKVKGQITVVGGVILLEAQVRVQAEERR